jgi:prevent-host-death family protein
MKIASVADVKAKFSSYIKESEEGAVVVTRNGRPVAVLLGVHDDDEVERLILAHSRRLRAILERSKQQIRDGEQLSHEDFWKQVEIGSVEPRVREKARPKARGRKPRKS